METKTPVSTLLILLAGIGTADVLQAVEPVVVGSTPRLLVDDFLVEKLEGVRRVA